MWESDKGILELFGGSSSLLKNAMHMREMPKIHGTVEKARQSNRRRTQCPGCLCAHTFVSVHEYICMERKPSSQYMKTVNSS